MIIKKHTPACVGWKEYFIIKSDFLRNLLKFMLNIQFGDQLFNSKLISSRL